MKWCCEFFFSPHFVMPISQLSCTFNPPNMHMYLPWEACTETIAVVLFYQTKF